jgi:hypothetical protein
MRKMGAVLLLAVASVARAQLDPGPGRNSDHERVPKAERYVNYLNDEQRARKEFEAAAKAMLSPKYRNALAKFEPGDGSDLIPAWGEFITAAGTEFVALQLALPSGSGLHANTEYTFFGIVTGADGKEIATYNETIPTWESKGDLIVDRSLLMPAAKARGTFGLANRGEILGMTRVDFEPEALTKDSSGISRVIASSDVRVLPAQQKPLDPFAFGGTKVVPKPRHAFRNTDEVWLFTELRNPKLGDDGAPHVVTKVEVDGPAKLPGKILQADATPLKGVAGHYGIGNTVDLSKLVPGDYRLKVTVTDTIAKQSFRRETTLTIVE